jgi:hypothetical protein
MGKAQQVWDIHKMKVKLSYCLVIGWALLCMCLHLRVLSYAKCMLPSLLLLRPQGVLMGIGFKKKRLKRKALVVGETSFFLMIDLHILSM